MNKILIFTLFFCQSLLTQSIYGQVLWHNRKFDVDSLIPKAVTYLRDGKLDESIMLSRAVLAKYPKYTDFRYILGLSYKKIGRGDWAIPYFEQVLQADTSYKDVYLPLAMIYESHGNNAKAREIWQFALKRFPNDKEIITSYREFQAKDIANKANLQMDSWYQAGRRSLEQGEIAKALAYSDSIQAKNAKDARYLYLRSNAFMYSKDFIKAKAIYETMYNNGDSSIFVIEQLANVAAANKDYKEALRFMDRLQQKSASDDRYKQLAKVYRENLPYNFYVGVNHMQSSQDRPNGHFFISGLEYGHKIGKNDILIGQFNYGNRRGEKGTQLGLNAWINYSSNVYAYHSLVLADGSVFPTSRAAYSVYHEAGVWLFDLGSRYVRSSDKTNNYGLVASTGRHFGSTFVYLRGFLLKDEQRWNQAYSLAVRHYYNSEKPNSYVTVIGNIGTSPDDPARYQFLNNRFDFLSRSINAGLQHRIENWGFTVMGGWSYYKITENKFMNQYDLNLSLRKYF